MTEIEANRLRDLINHDAGAEWWSTLPKAEVKERIWAATPQTGFIPDDIDTLFGKQCVLDFCCGIGRNVTALRQAFGLDSVIGYDLYGMLQHMPDEVRDKYALLSDDLPNLVQKIKQDNIKIHTIYASLCIQHIHPELLYMYFDVFAKEFSGHRLLVNTRWYHDYDRHSTTVCDLLEDYYDVSELKKKIKGKETGEFHYTVELLHG